MRYIFELNHPKHYYQFKYVIESLENDGHDILVIARDKDILLKVLDEQGVPYVIFGEYKRRYFSKIIATFGILRRYFSIARGWRPDVIISKASFYGCFVARITGVKSIIFPDSEVVKVTNRFVVPLCTKVVTPQSFGLSYGEKQIRVPGIYENCYLSPEVFSPSVEVIDRYHLKRPYAILRFVGWFANHDVHNGGFSQDEKMNLIGMISKHMTVYVSSERELPAEMLQYKLPTPAALIHSVLAFADLYVGDSQTMATEAALLGTPSIRSNSFVGEHDMNNFKILEKKYGLIFNIAEYSDVLSVAGDFASNSRKNEWISKQKAYFANVGDINILIRDIIERV